MEEQEKRTAQRTINNGVKSSLGFAQPGGAGKELASRAGQISQRKSKQRRAAKDILLDILHSDSTNKDLAELAKTKGVEPSEMATLLLAMTQKAGRSAQMAELVFKLTGDIDSTPQQNITIVNQLSDEQLLAERRRILGHGDDCINITPEPPKLEE